MALQYSKQLLSGSTAGKFVEINNTSSPGTTIHTVVATATAAIEEVYIYVQNSAATDTEAVFTCEFGGTATADHVIFSIPGRDGLYQIIPGIPMTATTSIIRAFATATGLFHVGGWVNRAT